MEKNETELLCGTTNGEKKAHSSLYSWMSGLLFTQQCGPYDPDYIFRVFK